VDSGHAFQAFDRLVYTCARGHDGARLRPLQHIEGLPPSTVIDYLPSSRIVPSASPDAANDGRDVRGLLARRQILLASALRLERGARDPQGGLHHQA